MNIVVTLTILKERTINFLLINFTPASKNYSKSEKSPGSVVGYHPALSETFKSF